MTPFFPNQAEEFEQSSRLQVMELQTTLSINNLERERLSGSVSRLGEDKLITHRYNVEYRQNEEKMRGDIPVTTLSNYSKYMEERNTRIKGRCRKRLEDEDLFIDKFEIYSSEWTILLTSQT
jgi:hypothetical protein